MTIIEKIRYIKSFKEPPFLKDDIYYFRNPWSKFGGISSGICMGWHWYKDDVILDEITEEDLELAYEEIKKFYELEKEKKENDII